MASNITVSYKKMTALSIYLDRVNDIYSRARAEADDLSYIPPQMGGIEGQRATLRDKLVVQDISFENRE